MTPGFASVAAAVLDHNGTPLAGIACTYDVRDDLDLPAIVDAVSVTARRISRRIGGH